MKSKEKYLTLAILRANNACDRRYDYLAAALGPNFGDETPLKLTTILEINGITDCLWAFCCFDDALKTIAVKFAVWCARKVLHVFENEYPGEYPGNDGPRKAIEAAEKWLDDPTDENARAASVAASAADAVANVAYAVYAAYAVDVAEAARDAADAADAAYAAARDAARAAYAVDAARAALIKRIYAARAAADAADAAEKLHELLTEQGF